MEQQCCFKSVTSIRHEWSVSVEKIEIPGEEEISARPQQNGCSYNSCRV